jgi:p-aminobenzoyl-glutamate transporter AbgT
MNHRDQQDSTAPPKPRPKGILASGLDLLERLGNKLPDPAVLFLIGMLTTWVLSCWLSGIGVPGIRSPKQSTHRDRQSAVVGSR